MIGYKYIGIESIIYQDHVLDREPDLSVTCIERRMRWDVWVEERLIKLYNVTKDNKVDPQGFVNLSLEHRFAASIEDLHPLDKAYLEYEISKALEESFDLGGNCV